MAEPTSPPIDKRMAMSVADVRLAFLRVLGVALAVSVLYTPFDIYVAAAHYPDVSASWCIAWRGLASFFIAATWLVVRLRPSITLNGILALGSAVTVASLGCIGAMAVPIGGLETSYHFAPAFYAVALAAFVPTSWRTTTLLIGPALVVFLAIIVIGVALTPELAGQLDRAESVSSFVENNVRVLALMGFAGWSAHVHWRARLRLDDAYRLGRYLLKEPIGQGGMSEVWRAWDSVLKRDVALKLLHSPRPEDARRTRFEREARATSGLGSPHTVRIYDYGHNGRDTFWIAMEYLRGLDLDKLITTHGRLDPRRALHFARQAAASLAEAHAKGIVHRDIKPANLFALAGPDETDFLKLLDFGIARQLDSREATLTLVGMVVGTPAFMAPEALTGEEPAPTSDVYSLGATLYTMLTAALPFDPSGTAPGNTARLRLKPPSERNGQPLPRELDELVMRCLDPDPARRPQSGAALAEALDAIPLAPWSPEEARAWWAERTATVVDRSRAPDPHTSPTLA